MASIGQIFGKYKLRTRIASTSLGEVWIAREHGAGMLAQDVALKILSPQVSADPAFVKLYLDEARRAAPLTHQHVARTLDLLQHEGTYGLVTELVPGETLTAVLQRAQEAGTAIPVRLAVTLAYHAAQALHATHTRADNLGQPLNLVHRCMTPNNMIVGFGGILKVTDVGTAWVVTQVDSLRAATGPRKYSYMSPEQCLNTPLDLRTDVFSLGVVVWELLAGRQLHQGADEFAIKQAVSLTQPAALDGLRADVSTELNRAVLHALAKNPADRWPSAQAFGAALLQALQPLGGPVPPAEVASFMASLFPQRHAWWGKALGQAGAPPAASHAPPASAPPVAPNSTAPLSATTIPDFDDDDDDLSFGDDIGDLNVEATLTDFKIPEGLDLTVPPESFAGIGSPDDTVSTLDEPLVSEPELPPAPNKPAAAAPKAPAPPLASAPSKPTPPVVAPTPPPEAQPSPPEPFAIPAKWDGDATLDEPIDPEQTLIESVVDDLVESPVDMARAPAKDPTPAGESLPPLRLVPDGYEPDPYVEDPYVEQPVVPEFRLTEVVAKTRGNSRSALGEPTTEILQHRGGSALSSHSLREKSKPFKAPHADLGVSVAAGGVATVRVGAGLSGQIQRVDGGTEAIQAGTSILLRDGDRAELETDTDSWIVRVFRPPLRPRGLEMDISAVGMAVAVLLAFIFVVGIGVAINQAEQEGLIVKVEKPQKEKFANARIRKIESLKPKKKKKRVRIKRVKPKKLRKPTKRVAKNKTPPKPKPEPKVVVKPPSDPNEAKPKITSKQRERITKLNNAKYAGKTKKEKVTKMFETPSKGAASTFKDATSNVQAVKSKGTSGAYKVAGDPTHLPGGEVRMAVGGGTGTGPVTKGGPAATSNVPKLAARAKPTKVRGKVSGLRAAARVSGSLSRSAVLKVIGKHMGRIRRCYERQLMANPRLAGKLTAQWSVTASGRVSGARQRTSTLGNGKVSSCVLKVIRGMKFPKPTGGAVKITYPFIFRSVS